MLPQSRRSGRRSYHFPTCSSVPSEAVSQRSSSFTFLSLQKVAKRDSTDFPQALRDSNCLAQPNCAVWMPGPLRVLVEGIVSRLSVQPGKLSCAMGTFCVAELKFDSCGCVDFKAPKGFLVVEASGKVA